ncbi:2',3'-cyclic-nucleotide 2'-phosphodiesterase [Streptococcus thermophilus]|nr:2',3'-cyclic-nucleotide 2'-phosphodiesterase [Streptococcus thermophilus]
MTIIKISRLKALVCPKLLVLIKKARETNPNTVLVDSGDTIQGTPFGTYKDLIDPVAQGETHPMYKAFEMLGYDAETLGNHEFNYGLEFLDRMVKAAKINVINANVRNAQTGDYYYNPYKIVNKTLYRYGWQTGNAKNRYYWCPSNADFGLG